MGENGIDVKTAPDSESGIVPTGPTSDRPSERRWNGLEWPILPALVYFLALSFGRVDIGIRYLLPAFPLAFLAAGVLLAHLWSRKWGALVIASLVAWLGLESVRYHPHYLAYFNQLTGGPREGWRYLADSNVDWGQALFELKTLMKQERVDHLYLSYVGGHLPEALEIQYQGLPDSRTPGTMLPLETPRELLAISVINRLGVLKRDKTLYRWLDQVPLLATIGYGIHVFDITRNAEAHRQLAALYDRVGSSDLAARERARVERIEASVSPSRP